MEKNFNKELQMSKEDKEDFKDSTKCWICDNDYVDKDVKVKSHCHITGKYRSSAYRDININLKLNHKIPIIFHNLQNYDSYLNVQETRKFSLEVNIISNGNKHANSVLK